MSENPFFQFYPSDWLAGTRGLTSAETGVYITLIAMMYEAEGPIKNDAKRLSRLCGSTPSAFKKAVDGLVSTGKIVSDERGFFNRRVEIEIEKRSEKRAAASASAKQRWVKTEGKQCPSDADAYNSQCERNANQNPDTRDKEEPNGSKKVEGFAELSVVLDEAHALSVIQHRRKIRKPLTARAAQLLAGKFSKTRDPNASADAMVSNGWQGFEPEWMDRQKSSAAKVAGGSILSRYDWVILSDGRVKSKAPGDDEWLLHDGVTAEQVESVALRDSRPGKQEAPH